MPISMAFGFPRSVSQLTTDVQQLSKECNSCNSNFNELRKEIRETQSAPPQASTKWITNLTKQKNEKKKRKNTKNMNHESWNKKRIPESFPLPGAKRERRWHFGCSCDERNPGDFLRSWWEQQVQQWLLRKGTDFLQVERWTTGETIHLPGASLIQRNTIAYTISIPREGMGMCGTCASFWWCRHCLKMTSVSAYSLCCWEYHLSSSRKSVIRVKFEGCAREREQIQPACSSTASSSTASSSTASSSIASSSIASSSIASSSIASSSIARTHCWHLAVNSVFASCWQKWKRGSRSRFQ